MVEYNYPECTTSVITSLAIFRSHYPNYRSGEINTTIEKAIGYLHAAQTAEGGWVGNWGICFSYAALFASESLSLVGETYANSKYAKKSCEFLLSKQRSDGGWGESYQVCFGLALHSEHLLSIPPSHASKTDGWTTRILRSCRPAGRQWHSCTTNTQTLSLSNVPFNSSCQDSCL